MSTEGASAGAACTVCASPFSELNAPRLHSCGHSFCGACVAKQAFVCPHDRQALGAGEDAAALPIDYALLDALAAAAPPPTPDCEVCDESHKATKRCIECGENMCDAAAAFHARSKASKDHRQLSVTELGSNPQLAAARLSTYCDVHAQEAFKFFDRDCRRLLCRDCMALDHKNHNCVSVATAAEQLRRELDAASNQVLRRAADLDAADQKVAVVCDALKAKCAAESARIHAEFALLHQALEEREAALLAQLTAKHTAKHVSLASQSTLLRTFSVSMRAAVARSVVSAFAPSDAQFLLSHPALHTTLAALARADLPLQPRTDAALEFFVSRADATAAINAIGVVVDKATAAALCTAQGSALDLARPGVVSRFVVTARDPQGAPRGIGGDAFSLDMRLQSDPKRSVAVAVEDKRDGTYACAYRLPVEASGRWVLTIRLHDTHIAGSPFLVDIDTANLSWDTVFVGDRTGTAAHSFAFANNDLSASKTSDAVKIQTIRSAAPLPPAGVPCKWRVRVDALPDRTGNLDIGFGRNCGDKTPWLRGCEIFGDFCVSEPVLRAGDMIECSFDAAAGKGVFRRLHPETGALELLKEVTFEKNSQAKWYALASLSVGCGVSFH